MCDKWIQIKYKYIHTRLKHTKSGSCCVVLNSAILVEMESGGLEKSFLLSCKREYICNPWHISGVTRETKKHYNSDEIMLIQAAQPQPPRQISDDIVVTCHEDKQTMNE